MSQLKVDEIVDASGGSNAVLYGPASPAGSMGFRNRIINGDMRIDQRNVGASVTAGATDAYCLDRWKYGASQASKYTVQQSSTAPAGFTNSLLVTSSSAYSVLTGDFFRMVQQIEGYNIADLGWGAAGAKSVTLSFWVRSSLTGTFGGSVMNSAGNRSYPFTYSIASANTWEQKTVTVPGDTSGTWLTNNGSGIQVQFGLGVGSTYSGTAGAWAGALYVSATGATSVVGTNGATWYITGVQLEVGAVASEFERRDIGRELIMCQRYFEKSYNQATVPGTAETNGVVMCADMGSFGACQGFRFVVTKRTTPTITGYAENGTAGSWNYPGNTATVTFGDIADSGVRYTNVTGRGSNPVNGHFTASAEL